MKKKLISTLLCVSMVATMLVGCGGNDEAADDGNAGTETEAEEGDDTEAEEGDDTEAADDGGSASAEGGKVYYLNFKPESDDIWQQIAAEYTEATGTEVKVVTAASGQYEATLTSEIVKEDAPTLFQVNGPIGYQNWKDYCMDLKDTDFYSWLLDKSLAIEGEDGGVYGIPCVVEGYGIIYNQAIMDKYFATEGAKAASMEEINNFAKLKEVVEDMTAKKAELEIDGVFASTSLLPGEDWRWQTHLANLPVYYELKDSNATDLAELEFKYAENYKNVFDLYINNSCSEPGTLTTMDVTSSMAEFALGQVAMVQNGNWGWSQINGVDGNTVAEGDVKFLPIYTGVTGEENQGLCVGTENFFCVNSKASEADQAATVAFLEWLYSSPEGKAHVTNDLGFIAPFNTFEDSDKPTDPLAQEVLRYMEDSSKTSVSWNFTIFPSQAFKDDFGFALGDYCNGSKTWEEVVETVKTRWAEEKAATATAE